MSVAPELSSYVELESLKNSSKKNLDSIEPLDDNFEIKKESNQVKN